MDRLDAMIVFVATVETGSFSAASRKLGMPLPTIARKVADLEAHIGTRLLTRSTRKLALTEAGATYLERCRRILEEVTEAETEASGAYTTPRGELVLAAPIVFGRLHLVPLVNDFLAHYPDINAKVILSDRNADLVEEHIDVAIRIGALPDSSLSAIKVGEVRRVVCGSPDYFAANGVPQTLDDLTDLTCVTFSGMGSGASWTFGGPGRKQARSFRPKCRLNINTAESAIDAAIAGIGVTHVMSYQIAQAVAKGTLRIALEQFEPEPIPVNLLHAGRNHAPLKMRRFLDFAAPRLRDTLSRI